MKILQCKADFHMTKSVLKRRVEKKMWSRKKGRHLYFSPRTTNVRKGQLYYFYKRNDVRFYVLIPIICHLGCKGAKTDSKIWEDSCDTDIL